MPFLFFFFLFFLINIAVVQSKVACSSNCIPPTYVTSALPNRNNFSHSANPIQYVNMKCLSCYLLYLGQRAHPREPRSTFGLGEKRKRDERAVEKPNLQYLHDHHFSSLWSHPRSTLSPGPTSPVRSKSNKRWQQNRTLQTLMSLVWSLGY